jgi:hypothetical protein
VESGSCKSAICSIIKAGDGLKIIIRNKFFMERIHYWVQDTKQWGSGQEGV